MDDTIIAELHEFREEWTAQFNYDIHAMVADLRRSQQEENRQVVTLPPKRVTASREPERGSDNYSLTHRVS